jgi:hypothetical protein
MSPAKPIPTTSDDAEARRLQGIKQLTNFAI